MAFQKRALCPIPRDSENASPKFFVIASPKLNKRLSIGLFLKRACITLALAAVPAYAAFMFTQTKAAPALTVDVPSDYTETTLPSILVSGTTSPEGEMFINGETILLHENGEWSLRVPLSLGANIVKIVSRNNQNEAEITRTVIRK